MFKIEDKTSPKTSCIESLMCGDDLRCRVDAGDAQRQFPIGRQSDQLPDSSLIPQASADIDMNDMCPVAYRISPWAKHHNGSASAQRWKDAALQISGIDYRVYASGQCGEDSFVDRAATNRKIFGAKVAQESLVAL